MNIKYISLFLVLVIAGLDATTIGEEFDKRHKEYALKVNERSICEVSYPLVFITCRKVSEECTLKRIAYEEISDFMKDHCKKEIRQAAESGAVVNELYREAMNAASTAIKMEDKRAKCKGGTWYGSKAQGIKAKMKWCLLNGHIVTAYKLNVAVTPYSITYGEIQEVIKRANKAIDTLCDAEFVE